jgi:uncharacterized membrane protein
MLPLLALLVPALFIKGMGMAMTWLMTWLMLLVVLPFAVFAVYRGRLMNIKREKGWRSEASAAVSAELRTAAAETKRVGQIWFVIPFALSLIPAAAVMLGGFDGARLLLYGTFAALTGLFWWFYGLIFRLRAEAVNENLNLTIALTCARRYQWGKFWVAAAWLTGLLNPVIWLFEDNVMGLTASMTIYALVLLALAIQTEFGARIAQQKLCAGNMGGAYQDEDEFWLLGMFYHNPEDKHFLVNDRIGMNMTVNLAKPGAKLLMIFAALCIAAMPLIGVWIWTEEATPVSLTVGANELTARHTRIVYTVSLDDIETVELIEELPYAARVAGSALDNLYKGLWSVKGYGNTRLCLRPENPPFIVVAAGGQTYILNDSDGEITREIYRILS